MKVYHGLSKVMMFERFTAYFNQPVSTTIEYHTALKFSQGQGIVLEFRRGGKNPSLIPKYLDVSWLSTFPEEDERLFYGDNIVFEIFDIIETKGDVPRKHKRELRILNMFQKMVKNHDQYVNKNYVNNKRSKSFDHVWTINYNAERDVEHLFVGEYYRLSLQTLRDAKTAKTLFYLHCIINETHIKQIICNCIKNGEIISPNHLLSVIGKNKEFENGINVEHANQNVKKCVIISPFEELINEYSRSEFYESERYTTKISLLQPFYFTIQDSILLPSRVYPLLIVFCLITFVFFMWNLSLQTRKALGLKFDKRMKCFNIFYIGVYILILKDVMRLWISRYNLVFDQLKSNIDGRRVSYKHCISILSVLTDNMESWINFDNMESWIKHCNPSVIYIWQQKYYSLAVMTKIILYS
eukprot:516442_1